MLRKILRILNEEGFKGLYQRLRIRFLYIIKPKITKSAYGVKLYSKWGDATFNLCLNGTYGYFFYNFLNNIEKPSSFVDIGANQGIYTLIASKNRNIKKIYSFEPVPENFKSLKKNIKLNSFDKITTIKAAISSQNKNRYISFNKFHTGTSSLDLKKNNTNKLIKIKTINFKYLKKLIKHNYNLIIKIDVEGHELVVLEQIVKSNLIIKVDYIFIEINFKRNNLIKIRRILKKFKFIEIYKSKIINNHSDFLFEKRN
jgi:FkbM family methyltransferase